MNHLKKQKAAAAVLIILVLVINTVVKVIGGSLGETGENME
jgi:hypothetical protein